MSRAVAKIVHGNDALHHKAESVLFELHGSKDSLVTDHSLNNLERRAVLTLGSVYALRMLGLFVILPVFAIYAETLARATPLCWQASQWGSMA